MPHHTVRLHGVLRAQPEKVYRAFLEAGAMAKWLPPYGFTCMVHHLGCSCRRHFPDVVPQLLDRARALLRRGVPGIGARRLLIRYTDKFDDPNLPGEMQVTVSQKAVSCGTELSIVQEGIPEAIPLEICYLGWQESLVQLAQLVEPEIPG